MLDYLQFDNPEVSLRLLLRPFELLARINNFFVMLVLFLVRLFVLYFKGFNSLVSPVSPVFHTIETLRIVLKFN